MPATYYLDTVSQNIHHNIQLAHFRLGTFHYQVTSIFCMYSFTFKFITTNMKTVTEANTCLNSFPVSHSQFLVQLQLSSNHGENITIIGKTCQTWIILCITNYRSDEIIISM